MAFSVLISSKVGVPPKYQAEGDEGDFPPPCSGGWNMLPHTEPAYSESLASSSGIRDCQPQLILKSQRLPIKAYPVMVEDRDSFLHMRSWCRLWVTVDGRMWIRHGWWRS